MKKYIKVIALLLLSGQALAAQDQTLTEFNAEGYKLSCHYDKLVVTARKNKDGLDISSNDSREHCTYK